MCVTMDNYFTNLPLAKHLLQKKITIVEEHLWRILQDEWRKITPSTLEKLVARLPNICQAVNKSRGGHIDESKI
ncbi:unnamed protein product [Euphydryas editha]|uniref:PiggyBac transposable element-derived protein domain-containing protein n=1 Tax=Euphydryas editha TaxID=104508 RepID=A0AAU9TRP1_EUPED|nr:unnamed protein product [Euphydryas editha]